MHYPITGLRERSFHEVLTPCLLEAHLSCAIAKYSAVKNELLGNPMNKGVRSATGAPVKRLELRSIGYIGTAVLWERWTDVLVQP